MTEMSKGKTSGDVRQAHIDAALREKMARIEDGEGRKLRAIESQERDAPTTAGLLAAGLALLGEASGKGVAELVELMQGKIRGLRREDIPLNKQLGAVVRELTRVGSILGPLVDEVAETERLVRERGPDAPSVKVRGERRIAMLVTDQQAAALDQKFGVNGVIPSEAKVNIPGG
jgi:hypothetical protein